MIKSYLVYGDCSNIKTAETDSFSSLAAILSYKNGIFCYFLSLRTTFLISGTILAKVSPAKPLVLAPNSSTSLNYPKFLYYFDIK